MPSLVLLYSCSRDECRGAMAETGLDNCHARQGMVKFVPQSEERDSSMRFAEYSSGPHARMRALPYYRFVVLGLLGLNSLLLQQFLTLNRVYLASRATEQDIGLTIPGWDVPTTQFVICALAVSLPCLTILGAHYTFVAPGTSIPRWIESLLWLLGVTGAGVALTATFWFMSPLASAIFVALGFLCYLIYSIAVAVRAKRDPDTSKSQ
jgi:hypothetical protein